MDQYKSVTIIFTDLRRNNKNKKKAKFYDNCKEVCFNPLLCSLFIFSIKMSFVKLGWEHLLTLSIYKWHFKKNVSFL